MRTSREFFCLAALLSSVLGTLAGPVPALAEPAVSNTAPSIEKLIPADTKLPPAWVKSLFERGDRTVYRTGELDFIVMPLGGICAGQLYLGGDGRLWHWDIFNMSGGTGNGNYANPVRAEYSVEQGFAIRTGTGADALVLRLDRAGFTNISFCGEYPIDTVAGRTYRIASACASESVLFSFRRGSQGAEQGPANIALAAGKDATWRSKDISLG